MLLYDAKAELRIRYYSRRTEDSYLAWIRRFVLFHEKRHPCDMGEPDRYNLFRREER